MGQDEGVGHITQDAGPDNDDGKRVPDEAVRLGPVPPEQDVGHGESHLRPDEAAEPGDHISVLVTGQIREQ